MSDQILNLLFLVVLHSIMMLVMLMIRWGIKHFTPESWILLFVFMLLLVEGWYRLWYGKGYLLLYYYVIVNDHHPLENWAPLFVSLFTEVDDDGSSTVVF